MAWLVDMLPTDCHSEWLIRHEESAFQETADFSLVQIISLTPNHYHCRDFV